MSCPICRRSSCNISFHSLAEQERYEERQSMSDDVDDLRCEVQCLRAELEEAKGEAANLTRELDECEDALSSAGERIETLENELLEATRNIPDPR